jgi:RNA polymerase subunit RPABC4/transcription elongation factor Spt4
VMTTCDDCGQMYDTDRYESCPSCHQRELWEERKMDMERENRPEQNPR